MSTSSRSDTKGTNADEILKYEPNLSQHKFTMEYIESEINRLTNRRKRLTDRRLKADKKKSAEIGAIYQSLPTEEEKQVRKELKRFQNLRSRRNVFIRQPKNNV